MYYGRFKSSEKRNTITQETKQQIKMQPQIQSTTQIHFALSNYEKLNQNKPAMKLEEKMNRLYRDKKRIGQIMEAVCLAQGVIVDDLTSTRYRLQVLCFTRNLIVYFARKYTKLTLRDIARTMWTGQGEPYHHSTIIHSLKCCEQDISCRTAKDNFWTNYVKLDGLFEAEWGKKESEH
jgi:chromosomal replication initiation ATPase DnaA